MKKIVLALLLSTVPAYAGIDGTPYFAGGDCANAPGSIILTCLTVGGNPIGTSGASIPLLNGANTWSGVQTYTSPTRKSVALGLSAAGTTLATATPLTADINEVTTVASGAGVVLAPYNATLGGVQKQEVISVGANALAVYPPVSTAAIRNLNGSTAAGSAGAAASLAVGSHGLFECVSATLCYEAP